MVEEHLTILRELPAPKLVLKYVEETVVSGLPMFSAASLGQVISHSQLYHVQI